MKRIHEGARGKEASTSREAPIPSVLAPPARFSRPIHRSTLSQGQAPFLATTALTFERVAKPPPTPKVAYSRRQPYQQSPRVGSRVTPAHARRVSPLGGDFKAPIRPAIRVSPPRTASTHRRAASLPGNAESPKGAALRVGNRKGSAGIKRTKYAAPVRGFGHSTHVGYAPGNPSKVNQDNYIEVAGFASHPTAFLFGVCDGHGTYGKEVSMYAKQRLPILLGLDPALTSTPKNCLTYSVLQVNEELTNSSLDIAFSGSTLVTTLIFGTTLWCANVGDSRAVLARKTHESWLVLPLSRDHKPDDEDESMRITSCGGRIAAYQDEMGNPIGPARVWLKDQNIPGLAMSRSLGDLVASTAGVICIPEITEITLETDDKFLVIGSDGVFEFMSNEDVVRTVVPYWAKNDLQGACNAVMTEARARWMQVRTRQEEEVIDDVTCVVIFLDVGA